MERRSNLDWGHLLQELRGVAALTGQQQLALFGDLTGKLYVANRDNLGGYTAGGPDKILQTLNLPNEITSTPAYSSATAAIYVAAAYDHLKMFPFSGGTLAGSPRKRVASRVRSLPMG